MWEAIVNFFTAEPWWMLILILFAKAIEVAISTLRIIVITKGYRGMGTFLAFIEIVMWVFIAGYVLGSLMEVPIRGVMYAIGFTAGIYLGSIVEEKLAFGKIFVQIITPKTDDEDKKLVKVLRENSYGATTIDAHGKDADKTVIMSITNRKNHDLLFKLIEENSTNSIITTNDIQTMKGGYIKSYRSFKRTSK